MNQWFNRAAFAVPAPYTFGNAARNLLFTPGDIVVDASILKDFTLHERAKVQFRAEFFNMPNHFNWSGPASNISVASTVGRITSGGEARVVQFGLKVLF